MYKLLFVLILFASPGWSAEWSDLGSPLADSLPQELRNYLGAEPAHQPYSLMAWLNPYYLRADFNGDGSSDIAVLVQEKATDKKGIFIIHGDTHHHFVLGAGTAIGNGGDDFSWMDAWYVHPRGSVGQTADEDAAPPALKWDALMVIKIESASGVIYWTGTGYAWRQQGD